MLEALAVLLFVLWMIAHLASYTVGGYIHVLLVAAAILLLVRLVGGRANYSA
jgi:hypothetical protein